jgi:hypothetical protein
MTAAVMDGRHATSEACSPLPGRSLTDCEHAGPMRRLGA